MSFMKYMHIYINTHSHKLFYHVTMKTTHLLFRETMIQAAEMYKNMGSDLMNMMNGMGGGMGNMDFGSAMGNTLLDELSEDE